MSIHSLIFCLTKIIVYDKTQFNPKHIVECGQIFRYIVQLDGSYKVFSGDNFAVIAEQEDSYQISTKSVEYFERFFDLTTDYNNIKKQISINATMQTAVNFGYGIRILHQQPLEMIISFIISANNNIKRIQTLVERLCTKFGTCMGDYFAFPTLKQLQQATVQDLKDMGMGFRAKYIYNTVRLLQNTKLNKLYQMPTLQLLQFFIFSIRLSNI